MGGLATPSRLRSDVRVPVPVSRRTGRWTILAAAVAAGAIIGYSALARATNLTQAPPEAPQVRIALDRSDFAANEIVRGSLVITARDAARLSGAQIFVYAEGVPQRPGNEVATLVLEAASSDVGAGQTVRSMISWNQQGTSGLPVPRGTYLFVAAVQAQTDRGNQHVFATVGTAAEVRLRD